MLHTKIFSFSNKCSVDQNRNVHETYAEIARISNENDGKTVGRTNNNA